MIKSYAASLKAKVALEAVKVMIRYKIRTVISLPN